MRPYCSKDDRKEFEFIANSGNVAFGGMESVCSIFKPNSAIRSDTEIPAGRYHAEVYRTEYPEEFIENKIAESIGAKGAAILDFTPKIIGAGVVAAIAFLLLTLLVSKYFLIGLALAIGGCILWLRKHTNMPEYRQMEAVKAAIENEYPSIVVKLTRKES